MTPQQRAAHEAEGFFTLKKSPGAGFCGVNGCRRKHARHKLGLCHCHSQYRWRMKSPKRSAYSALRDHAKGRGIKFTISYDYYCGMLDCVGYWDHTAESRGEALSIDRLDATKGYVFGNLRVISISLNATKSNKERYLPDHVQSIIARKRATAKENPHISMEREDADDRCPF